MTNWPQLRRSTTEIEICLVAPDYRVAISGSFLALTHFKTFFILDKNNLEIFDFLP